MGQRKRETKVRVVSPGALNNEKGVEGAKRCPSTPESFFDKYFIGRRPLQPLVLSVLGRLQIRLSDLLQVF